MDPSRKRKRIEDQWVFHTENEVELQVPMDNSLVDGDRFRSALTREEGGFRYGLLVFPKGSEMGDGCHISAFVEWRPHESDMQRFNQQVRYRITVVNHLNKRNSLSQFGMWTFTQDKRDRGWHHMMRIDEATKENGWLNERGWLCIRAACHVRRWSTDLCIAMDRLPHYSRYSKTRTVRIDFGSSTYLHLKHEFMRTTTMHRGPAIGDPHRVPPKLEVCHIDRVFAPRLQEKYLAEVQDIAGLCNQKVVATLVWVDALPVESFEGLSLNEFLLYHGVPSHLVDRLQTQGLDPRYAGDHFGRMYGFGVYLASNSSKADIYTMPNDDDERCVLVCRACLGEPYIAKVPDKKLMKPPEREDGRGPLNSVVAATFENGGSVEHPEFIVYDKAQVLPEYAIWYTHAQGCACTHCV